MTDNDTPTPEFTKGFNDGYLIAKHEAELGDKIASALSGSDRSQGFKAGREEFLLEKEKERYPDWLKQDRLTSLDGGSIEKDKDDIDRTA